MPDAKYTPGPWKVLEAMPENDVPWRIVTFGIPARGQENIAICCEIDESGSSEANAHLIAAAPELIGALEEALPALHGVKQQRVVNALAKAERRK